MPDAITVLLILISLTSFLLFFMFLIAKPRPTTIQIKNRHVFITGGSSGIGLALACCMARDGARVSILSRSVTKLDEAKKSILLKTGVEVATYSADVRDFDAVQRAMSGAGPVDVLVISHGVYLALELEKTEPREVKFMIDVNLLGSFNTVKAALPGMKYRKGKGPSSIAFVSSQTGQVGIYGYTAYSATKFGLRGFAEALQQEVIVHDIHVSLVFPPDTDTPGFLEENKLKPELTRKIAGSSGASTAEAVAERALSGIKSGSFFVPCNLEGYLLSLATAGVAPQRSFLAAFVEAASASFLRVVALIYQWSWYRKIEKWHAS